MASDPVGKRHELGNLVTLPGSSRARNQPATAEAQVLGRYHLERKLGEGGMGVVHEAFDSDLHRSVALKVLRGANSNSDARDRLLREARAMARLTHPNVVTVHEVGRASGRDYVAMELITGGTLADWLRVERRKPAEVIAAFLAAGRGLVAAHASGIVHRDFKPHNVLRSREGRIVVTDFGLARDAQIDPPAQLDVTLPPSANIITLPAEHPPRRSLGELTMTGMLLGTPAYMAPEQWTGGPVTPATDQFAFCVALWEALVGERPYEGLTLDDRTQTAPAPGSPTCQLPGYGPTLEVRCAQVALGPNALDASRIPRRLRAILRRGLEPDPARRWPDMNTLLARIVRVERRSGVAAAVALGAMVVAAGLVIAIRGSGESSLAMQPCDPPSLDPARVWPNDARVGLGAQTEAVKLLDADMTAWRSARAAMCAKEPVRRAPRLACLDGVLTRFDAVARGVRALREGVQVDAGALLIDPWVCDLTPVPRLQLTTTPAFREAVTARLAFSRVEWMNYSEGMSADEGNALIQRTATDPCASSLAHSMMNHLDSAQQDAERCGDDRVRAEIALSSAWNTRASKVRGEATAKLRLAEIAVQRVTQRDLMADIYRLRTADRLDDEIADATNAMEGYAARGRVQAEIRAGLTMAVLRRRRASADDLKAIPVALERWRARAVVALGDRHVLIQAIDAQLADWAWSHGDLAEAAVICDRSRREQSNRRLVPAWVPLQKVTGMVVDQSGRPVAGATVSTGKWLNGDSLYAGAGCHRGSWNMRNTTSDQSGRFEIADAVQGSTVIAELGDYRSAPVSAPNTLGDNDVKLVIAPTSRLEGRVDLAGQPAVNVDIEVVDLAWEGNGYAVHAPVAADGSFIITGVPRGELRVKASIEGRVVGDNIVVRGPVMRGISLSLEKSRVIHILVRCTVNAKLVNGQVVGLRGNVASTTLTEFNRRDMQNDFDGLSAAEFDMAHAPKAVVGAAREGDLLATFNYVPDGGATVCAWPLPTPNDHEREWKVSGYHDRVQVTCAPIPDHGDALIIEVPPAPRLD